MTLIEIVNKYCLVNTYISVMVVDRGRQNLQMQQICQYDGHWII